MLDYFRFMASKILCTTSACGKPATHRAIRRGQTVGFVCGECRIGPNIDGQDPTDRRKDQERRAADVERLVASLQRLTQLRAEVFSLSPLQLSTATLAIGRRFDSAGNDAADFIDKTIDEVMALIQRIRTGEDYTMDVVAKRMALLRDGLAADASLDAFDAAVGPDMRRFMSDDARQLAAYRANPVQKIALLRDFGIDHVNSVVSFKRRLLVSSTGIGFPDNYAIDYRGNRTDMLPRYSFSNFASSVDGRWVSDGSGSIYHDSDPTITYPMPVSVTEYAVSRGDYICFVNNDSTVISCRVFRADKPSRTFVAQSAEPIDIYENPKRRILHPINELPLSMRVGEFLNRIAIDVNGNIWHIQESANERSKGTALIVLNSGGNRIARVEEPGCFAVSAGIDGVWVASYVDYAQVMYTNYRLVPPAEYNRGM